MRLQQITIENFGIYEGVNTFSFPYSSEKKVSIIIGKNGAGKTTFLNAVKTCFFGSLINKTRTITKGYEENIRNRLNKNALKDPLSSFSIEAIFISHLHRYDGAFSIKRSWSVDNGIFEEFVSMTRDNKNLNQSECEEFFNILYHTFTLDLFELFYLDGEKIDELSVLNTNLIELIETSINIDLFKTLKIDLEKYAIKKVKTGELEILEELKSNSLRVIVTEENQKNEIVLNINNCNTSIDQFQKELNEFKRALNITRISIDDITYKKMKEEIVGQKSLINEQLVSFLPYMNLTQQIQQIENQIDRENTNKEGSIIRNALSKDLQKHLVAEINTFEPKLVNEVFKCIKDYYSSNTHDSIHNLNSEDFYNLKRRIKSFYCSSKQNLKTQIEHLKKLEYEESQISQEAAELKAATDNNNLNDLLKLQDQLSKEQIKLNSYINMLNDKDETILSHMEIVKNAEKEIWRLLKKDNITNVTSKVNHILELYITRIKADKISIIENETKYMFDRLIRKSGFIKDFKINDQMVFLLDDHGNTLDHSHLSAGEKQLFILSLIYAIMKTSDRTVPMIFDTLLGRLDEGHRNNVFKEFIGLCPDQIIVLATDSEMATIDKSILETLVNKQYIIDFSKKNNQLVEMR